MFKSKSKKKKKDKQKPELRKACIFLGAVQMAPGRSLHSSGRSILFFNSSYMYFSYQSLSISLSLSLQHTHTHTRARIYCRASAQPCSDEYSSAAGVGKGESWVWQLERPNPTSVVGRNVIYISKNLAYTASSLQLSFMMCIRAPTRSRHHVW